MKLSAPTKEKLKTFMGYAFGEVIIVIIGILLALEFDTWQSDTEARETELGYLHGFVEDKKIDNAKMIDFFATKEKQYRAAIEILKYYENDSAAIHIDSFLYDLYTVSAWYDFNPTSNTYNQLINSGHFELIQNETIKHQIIELREAYDQLDAYHEHLLHDYRQYLYKIFEIIDLKTLEVTNNTTAISFAKDAEVQQQVAEVIRNTTVKNGVHLFRYNHEYQGRAIYLDILEKIKILLREINKEIKR